MFHQILLEKKNCARSMAGPEPAAAISVYAALAPLTVNVSTQDGHVMQ